MPPLFGDARQRDAYEHESSAILRPLLKSVQPLESRCRGWESAASPALAPPAHATDLLPFQTRDVTATSEEALDELQGTASLRVAHIVKQVLDEDLASLTAVDSSRVHMHLWMYRIAPSVEHFSLTFDALGNEREQYPLLDAFFKTEARLALIQELVPIFEWHKILFEVCRDARWSAMRFRSSLLLFFSPSLPSTRLLGFSPAS